MHFQENVRVMPILEAVRREPFSSPSPMYDNLDDYGLRASMTYQKATFEMAGVGLRGTPGEYLIYEERSPQKTPVMSHLFGLPYKDSFF